MGRQGAGCAVGMAESKKDWIGMEMWHEFDSVFRPKRTNQEKYREVNFDPNLPDTFGGTWTAIA